MTTTATDRYLARFRAVLVHIDAHLEDALDVDGLAEVATFSKYQSEPRLDASRRQL